MESPGPKDVAAYLRRVKVQRLRSTVDHGLEPLVFASSGS